MKECPRTIDIDPSVVPKERCSPLQGHVLYLAQFVPLAELSAIWATTVVWRGGVVPIDVDAEEMMCAGRRSRVWRS